MTKPSGAEKPMDFRDRKKNAQLVLGLVESHGSALRGYLARRLRSKDSANDLVQEVFARFLGVSRAERIKKPASYLFRIAEKVVAEFRLREVKHGVVDGSDALEKAESAGELVAPGDLLNEEHAKRELQRLLPKLGSLHRTVYLLRNRDGFSTQEIAKALQISHSKVKRCLVEANATLDEKLREGDR